MLRLPENVNICSTESLSLNHPDDVNNSKLKNRKPVLSSLCTISFPVRDHIILPSRHPPNSFSNAVYRVLFPQIESLKQRQGSKHSFLKALLPTRPLFLSVSISLDHCSLGF